MQIDLSSAAIGGVLFWLLGWVAKHFLDRLVLPRVLDWRARFSKQRALNRAEFILEQFERERSQSLDTRLLSLALGRLIIANICFIRVMISMLIIIIIGQLAEPKFETLKTGDIYILYYVPVSFVLFVAAFYYSWNRRLVSLFTNPAKHRDEIITRIVSLLKAADLSEDDIALWLARVSPAPVF